MKKDGPFRALQNDYLPLPEFDQVIANLSLTAHARQRFRERAQAGELSKKLLRSGWVSRHSPPWRRAEDYGRSLDLYLIFSFTSDDGSEDQGCLFLHAVDDRYVATTFVSRSSNQAQYGVFLPPIPGKIVNQVAKAGHFSVEQARQKISEIKPKSKRPAWIKGEHADQWIDGGSWAISLHYQLLGAGNPYHYRWGQVFSQEQERKDRNRQRYQRHYRQ